MRSGAPGTPVVSGCGILEAAAFGDTSAAIGDINLRRASDQTTEESAGHPRRAYSRALAARPVSRLTGCLRPSYDSTEPSVWLPFASPLPLPAALYPARPQRAVSSDRAAALQNPCFRFRPKKAIVRLCAIELTDVAGVVAGSEHVGYSLLLDESTCASGGFTGTVSVITDEIA